MAKGIVPPEQDPREIDPRPWVFSVKRSIMFDRKEYKRQWKRSHLEQNREQSRRYHRNHKEKELVRYRKYYKNNQERCLKYKRQHRQTPEGKLSQQKSDSKRRELGFVPLNDPFIGCVAHHISQDFVIYMPREVHICLYHNIWTWKNMEQMNKLAIEFL